MSVEPLVFKGRIADWEARKWTPNSLAALLGDKKLKFRIGRKEKNVLQLETKCRQRHATMEEFVAWNNGEAGQDHPLAEATDNCFAYSDYKHMKDVFAENPSALKAVDWSAFGFPGVDGDRSVLWVGSEKAYSVCHYDTYGCNLVAQIHGRKRWILYPPKDTEKLYPSRIPFEESSVFSQVNIQLPDESKHPLYLGVTAYVVTLEPGDVLFVPRHWWHFVQNLDTSISINTWIPLPEDDAERCKECITKTLLYAFMKKKETTEWLNPTEELSNDAENLKQLNTCMHFFPCVDSTNNNPKPATTVTASNPPQSPQKPSSHRKRRRSDGGNNAPSPGSKVRRIATEEASGDGHGDTSEEERIYRLHGGEPLLKCSYKQLQEMLNPEDAKSTLSPPDTHCGISQELADISLDSLTNVSGLSESTEDLVSVGSHESMRRPHRAPECLKQKDLLDCVLDPEVIELIRQKVAKKYSAMNPL